MNCISLYSDNRGSLNMMLLIMGQHVFFLYLIYITYTIYNAVFITVTAQYAVILLSKYKISE